MRAVAAYKYDNAPALANAPDGLARIAVVEVTTGEPVPPMLAQWDVTYYTAGEAVPANKALYAAVGYAWGDAIPNWLRKVGAWVAAAWGTLFGSGGLLFDDTENSHHIALVF